MAAGALAFSVMTAIAKLVGSRLPLFELVFGRSLVMLALAAFALRRQGRSFRATEPRLLVQRGLFGFASLVCYFYSVIHLPLADATVIFFVNPVITALVAVVVLREHMGWAQVLLVAVSLSGVVVVARPEFLFGSSESLDSLAVVSGVLAATFGAAPTSPSARFRTIRRCLLFSISRGLPACCPSPSCCGPQSRPLQLMSCC